MTTVNQTAARPAATSSAMPQSEFERLLMKDSKSKVEFKPYGSETAITLSIQIIRSYIAVPYKQGEKMVEPDDRQCMKFLMLCRARLLNPFEGDAFMIPFWDKHTGQPIWSLITSHQAFLKRGEIHPEYDGKRSGIIINAQRCKPCDGGGRIEGKVCDHCAGRGWYDELEGDYVPEEIDGETVELKGGWCRIYFKERKNPEYQRLKLATYNKGFGNWSFDAAGMICKCAEAAAMRGAFPTTLGGLYLREEMFGENDEGKFKAPEFGKGGKSSQPANLENGGGKSFLQPTKPDKLPDEPASDEAAEAAAGLAPVTSPAPLPPAEPPTPEQKYLKAIRALCKTAAEPEGRLLDLLASIGLTDGDVASLEDLALTKPDVLKAIHDKWPEYAKRLKEGK